MSEAYLLDTSALFTLLEDEAGTERVASLLRDEVTLIPWLCLVELHYVSQQERGLSEADKRYALVRATKAEIIWEASEGVLLSASSFKARHKLSLADALIAAFAAERGATLVHKDPEYKALSAEVTLEALPYK